MAQSGTNRGAILADLVPELGLRLRDVVAACGV